MKMKLAITEPQDLELFHNSISGYRNANAALDKAIGAENWAAINDAQNSRSMHASTIALIVNKFATEETGRATQ